MKLRSYLWFLLRPPMPVLLLISLLGWSALIVGGEHQLLHADAASAGIDADMHAQHYMPLEESNFNSLNLPVAVVLTSWVLMIAAMMLPLLSDAVRQVWEHSFPRRRLAGAALFLLGYIALWTAVGALLQWSWQFIHPAMADPLPMLLGLAIALLWQSTPWKQASLNRCHFVQRIHPFGLRYFVICIQYGLKKGGWCIASCWALMMVPMVAGAAGLPLMIAASLLMFLEQLQPPRAVRWHSPLALFSRD